MATPSESVVPAASRVRFPNTSTEARARGTSSPLTYTCTLIRISVGRWGEGSEDNKGRYWRREVWGLMAGSHPGPPIK